MTPQAQDDDQGTLKHDGLTTSTTTYDTCPSTHSNQGGDSNIGAERKVDNKNYEVPWTQLAAYKQLGGHGKRISIRPARLDRRFGGRGGGSHLVSLDLNWSHLVSHGLT